MKRRIILVIRHLEFAAAMLLLGCAMTGPSTQQEQRADAVSPSQIEYLHRGVVDDWTRHHVFFSNPGTLQDAIRNGRREEWERIVADSRYRMQWVQRYAPSEGVTADDTAALQAPTEVELPVGVFQKKWNKKEGFKEASLHGDWAIQLGSSTQSVALGKFPAKYTFAPIGGADCINDFVVFPINAAPLTNQANILGVNNLYSGSCTGAVPTVKFAYRVGTGPVQSSPVLSLDGTKIAFVETVANGSVFHVLTIGPNGNGGCPNAFPCNGNVFNSPAVPGTLNNASDKALKMTGNVTDSNSGPYVDYDNDIAYVGDDVGHLHKFTGVFKGTPAEAGSPWPFAATATASALTAPVYDSVSKNIFFGAANGNLYCVTSAGASCATNLISVASGTTPGAVNDAPIVDSSKHMVFATASNSTSSILLQATTALANPVRVNMGVNGTDLFDGAFDNAYFTSVGAGHMYFCGNLTTTGSATPTLYRVGFNTSGVMNSARDASSFQLVLNGQTGPANDCTPLTEAFNGTTDFLFVGVKENGLPTNCNGNTCIMSFNITSSFPSAPAVASTTGNLGPAGMSGMIVDNESSSNGASQIYFGSLQTSVGVQASQTTLLGIP